MLHVWKYAYLLDNLFCMPLLQHQKDNCENTFYGFGVGRFVSLFIAPENVLTKVPSFFVYIYSKGM